MPEKDQLTAGNVDFLADYGSIRAAIQEGRND